MPRKLNAAGVDIRMIPDDTDPAFIGGAIVIPVSRDAKQWLAWVEEDVLFPEYDAQVVRGRREAYWVPLGLAPKLYKMLEGEGFEIKLK